MSLLQSKLTALLFGRRKLALLQQAFNELSEKNDAAVRDFRAAERIASEATSLRTSMDDRAKLAASRLGKADEWATGLGIQLVNPFHGFSHDEEDCALLRGVHQLLKGLLFDQVVGVEQVLRALWGPQKPEEEPDALLARAIYEARRELSGFRVESADGAPELVGTELMPLWGDAGDAAREAWTKAVRRLLRTPAKSLAFPPTLEDLHRAMLERINAATIIGAGAGWLAHGTVADDTPSDTPSEPPSDTPSEPPSDTPNEAPSDT